MKTANFFDLVGQTLESITWPETGKALEDNPIVIQTGIERYRITHFQNCCESVVLEKVVGDPLALVGKKIDLAQDDHPQDPSWKDCSGLESHTWTLYRLGSGDVVVEFWFLGVSNGYYGEETEFQLLEPEDAE